VRGASALDHWLRSHGPDVAVAVVWEPVLDGDAAPPAARRLATARNYWDARRILSAALRRSSADAACVAAGDTSLDVVWDAIFVYPPGVRWTGDTPPAPLSCGRPIIRALTAVTAHIR
jgi:hypothetical protein